MSLRPSDPDTAQDALLAAYFEKRANLMRFFAARTGSVATAEDLAQDLYLKLAAREEAIDARSPAALLYRIATNVMLDWARSSRRAGARDGAWRAMSRADLGGHEISQEPAADEVLVSRERLRQLADAVESLPPQMGRAFRLHKLEGRSQAETAQAMGVSVKAIEKHIGLAIKALTRKLAP